MKPIPGFEGKYSITKEGEVFSHYRSKLLSQSDRGRGYLRVRLDGTTYSTHRLVAKTYIPNPDNLPQVNHKDGNKLNNKVNNLEWCDNDYNMTHAIKKGLRKTRSVISYDPNKGEGTFYPLLKNVEGDGYNPSHVLYCALKYPHYKSHKRMIWELI